MPVTLLVSTSCRASEIDFILNLADVRSNQFAYFKKLEKFDNYKSKNGILLLRKYDALVTILYLVHLPIEILCCSY